MPSRKISLETNIFYHIYNRGCNKQCLFYDRRDYEYFYNRMLLHQRDYPTIRIHCWCLLPNHFHFLLIEESSATQQISNYMRRTQQSFSMYFNAKYGEKVKKGKKSKIFEGRFKAKRIEREDYLSQVEIYINSNPVKHNLVDRPEEWPFGSYSIDHALSRVRTLLDGESGLDIDRTSIY